MINKHSVMLCNHVASFKLLFRPYIAQQKNNAGGCAGVGVLFQDASEEMKHVMASPVGWVCLVNQGITGLFILFVTGSGLIN